MKGGGGFLRRSEVSTFATRQTARSASSRTRAAEASDSRRGSVPSNLSFCPSNETSFAGNGGGAPASRLASTVQYSTGTNASISLSRSQMIRRATVWTRPAESPRQIFFQRRSDTSYPTRRSMIRRACCASTSRESISPASCIAASTAFLVISLNRTRWNRFPFIEERSASRRCHEIASPSRSGSAAR